MDYKGMVLVNYTVFSSVVSVMCIAGFLALQFKGDAGWSLVALLPLIPLMVFWGIISVRDK